MPFHFCFTELEYTAKLAKLAQTTKAAIIEEVRFVVIVCLAELCTHDEPNLMLWLTTQVGKMEICCLLGTTRFVLQEKISLKAI